jgi:hypothetical protein
MPDGAWEEPAKLAHAQAGGCNMPEMRQSKLVDILELGKMRRV